MLLPQRLNGLGRELNDTCLHVLEDTLVSICDDELVLEDFDLGPDGKVLGAGVEKRGGKENILSHSTVREGSNRMTELDGISYTNTQTCWRS